MAVNPATRNNHVISANGATVQRMTGAQIVCESLLREGVDVVFGYPGGAVLPLYHALPEFPQLRHILVRHEQGAGFGASGYARATGRPGVALVTSGPGVTNIVTAISDAIMDSVPMVVISGQVIRPLIGKDGFQEIDTTGITLPITKHNTLVMKAEDIALAIREAFHIARTGRPGPVLVDIPRDVQQEQADFVWPGEVQLRGYRPTLQGNQRQIRQAAEVIAKAERPLIIAGHGVIISGAYAELKELAEKADLPVITTLHGVSCFPESHELSFGLLGMHGSAYANRAVQECDLIVAIGMRFDDRACGRYAQFAPKAKIIHIDIDPAEIGKNLIPLVPVVGDVKHVLTALNPLVQAAKHREWVEQIREWRRQVPMTYIRDEDQLLPQYVIRQMYEATGGDATIAADVGQHQMFAAQHFWYDKPNSFISSGGLGSMGYCLPAAMGIKVARPDETVWAVIGDGSFQITLQELGTIMQEGIAVKIAIINNGYLGMVRQWQEFFYQRRYSASPIGQPDFVKLAESYGMAACRARTKQEANEAIERAMAHDGPFLIDFVVVEEENVYPMIPPGGSLSDIIIDERQRFE